MRIGNINAINYVQTVFSMDSMSSLGLDYSAADPTCERVSSVAFGVVAIVR